MLKTRERGRRGKRVGKGLERVGKGIGKGLRRDRKGLEKGWERDRKGLGKRWEGGRKGIGKGLERIGKGLGRARKASGKAGEWERKAGVIRLGRQCQREENAGSGMKKRQKSVWIWTCCNNCLLLRRDWVKGADTKRI